MFIIVPKPVREELYRRKALLGIYSDFTSMCKTIKTAHFADVLSRYSSIHPNARTRQRSTTILQVHANWHKTLCRRLSSRFPHKYVDLVLVHMSVQEETKTQRCWRIKQIMAKRRIRRWIFMKISLSCRLSFI